MRNYILTCIRHGIAAGASGLTIPKIQKRDDDSLGDLFAGAQPFSYLFDEEYFRNSLDQACPQITLYQNITEVEDYNEIRSIKTARFKSMVSLTNGLVSNNGVPDDRSHLGEDFYRWLNKKNAVPSLHKPVSVRLKWATFFEWDIARDGQEFANTFGRILKIRPDIIELAKKVMDELAIYSEAVYENGMIEEGDNGLPVMSYLRVHLRTEPDALGFWPSYEVQSDAYLDINSAPDLLYKYAYLASGSANETNRFKSKALKSR